MKKLLTNIVICFAILFTLTTGNLDAQCLSSISNNSTSIPAQGGQDYVYLSRCYECDNYSAFTSDNWYTVSVDYSTRTVTVSASANYMGYRTGVFSIADYETGNIWYVSVEQNTLCSISYPASSVSISQNYISPGMGTMLTVVGGNLGTGASWKWYTGACGSSYIGSGNSIYVTPCLTTTYYVRAEGSCNTTTCNSATVIVIY